MRQSPIVLLMAASFAAMTALLAIGSVVSRSPVAFFVAIPLGATAYFMYYHGSGKLLERLHRREMRQQAADNQRATGQRGGFGAGPRQGRGPRTRAEREARFGPQGRAGFGVQDRYDSQHRAPSASSGPTRAEARTVLGVEPTADQAAIKQAYRERVKDVHPDRGGNEDEFKRVTAAYERLRTK
ncbi:J domain-containing protein [Halobacteria archaeon AArc-curdl1]|uniref:J domain-containing protein n=1 Tax=Natronosalvus hydrolyticus TaxID=2979988 RepID=A0AAP2ZBV1_9EURY|nr:J domain-containing protein [Halobacteria archaeon AArc-curdl1]